MDSEDDTRVIAKIHFKSTDFSETKKYSEALRCSILSSGSGHLWEREPIRVDHVFFDSEFGIGNLIVGTRTGGSSHDEAMFLEVMLELSEKHVVAVDVEVDGNNLILCESCDILPKWLDDPSKGRDRVFVFKGCVCIIVPSELSILSSPLAAVNTLLSQPDHRHLINKAVTAYVRDSLLKRTVTVDYTHVGRVVLPQDLARIIAHYPLLVSVLVDFLPVDSDVNKAVLLGRMRPISFLAHSTAENTVSVGIRFTRLQWAKLRAFDEAEVLPVFRKHSSCNLIGMLLMSALCCVLHRRKADLLRIAFQASEPLKEFRGTCMDVFAEAMESINPQTGLSYVTSDTDESWLYEEPIPGPEERDGDGEPDDFAEAIERYLSDLGGDLESDDSCVDYSSLSGESYLEDPDACEFFEQMEEEVSKLRIGEDSALDLITGLMQSMDAEEVHQVGPGTVLHAAISRHNMRI